MYEQYLILRHVKVFGVSAHQNALVIGSPSPSTFCAAALKLCRDLDLAYDATAIIMHEWRLNQGHGRFVPQKPDQRTASTLDEVTGNIDASLIIKLQRDVRGGQKAVDDLERKVRANLHKIAGGTVIDCRRFGFNLVDTERDALAAIRQDQGNIMLDRTDMLMKGEPLQTLLDTLSIAKPGQIKKGWYAPMQIGFQAIEAPNTTRLAERKQVGDVTTPHVFAECMTGLVQYRSTYSIQSLKGCLWRFNHNAQEGTYYVAA